MKKIIAFLAAVLATNTLVSAQPTTKASDQSLLWRISGKQLQKPSYIFGTIHLICPNDYLWTRAMKESLDKSDKVCFEMDLDDPTLMMQIATGLVDRSGKTLEDYFTPAQYILTKNYVRDSLGMDVSMFARMKPIALESILLRNSAGCPDAISYEDTIMKTAQAAGKEILGLELAKDQLDVLETIPADSVIKDLMEEIQHTGKRDDKEFRQLTEAYKKQDLPALYLLIKNSKDLSDGLNKFLDDRNKKWIPRMTGKMGKSSVFFAVGAGHLWGDKGVIRLLKNQGYKVEAIK
jgi:uncharacterized protein YbaP (TraB family)